MTISRRDLMMAAAAAPVAASAAPLPRPSGPGDAAGWAQIAAQYDVTREVIQLENGNWGMMARPVLAAYERAVERVNRETSYYARRTMVDDLQAVRGQVAAELGVAADELVFTRNATEALTGLIDRYNRLRPGDAVLYADLD